VPELRDDLREGGAELVQLGGGEGGRGTPFQRGAGSADRFARRPAAGGQVQAYQAGVGRIGPADDEAGMLVS